MPNPFNKDKEVSSDSKPVTSKSIGETIESLFECYTCYEGVRKATYFPRQKRLEWVCSKGHVNEERDIKIV